MASADITGLEMEGEIGTEETPVNMLQRSAEEEGTTTRRKRKKKKKEIIYRSDLEDEDAGEGTSANVDGAFSPPLDEGEGEHYLVVKKDLDLPSIHPSKNDSKDICNVTEYFLSTESAY